MIFESLATHIFLNRKWSASLLVGISCLALLGLSKLEFDDDLDSIFSGTSKERILLDELSRQIDFEQKEFLILFEADDFFTNEVIALLRELHFDLQDVEGITNVQSILQARDFNLEPVLPGPNSDEGRFKKARELLGDVPGFKSKKETSATLLIAEPRSSSSIAELEPIYEELRSIGARISSSNLASVKISGLPSLRCEVVRIQKKELPLLILLGAIAGTCVALTMFKSGFAWFAIFPVPLIAAFWSLGLMGLTGRTFDLISIVIPPLAMAIAITDAVHLLCGIREKIEEGHTPYEASKMGICLVGPACFLSSLTTMLAFLSLALSPSPMLSRFGVTCAGVTLAVFLSTLLWVPFIASLSAGSKIARKLPPPDKTSNSPAFKHPRLIVLISLAILVVCLSLASTIRPDYRFSENLSEDNPAMAALEDIDNWFGFSGRLFVMIEWPANETLDSPDVQKALTSVEKLLRQTNTPTTPLSLISLTEIIFRGSDEPLQKTNWRDLPESIQRKFLNEEERRTVISLSVGDRGSRELVPLFAGIDLNLEEVREKYPGYRFELTGSSFVHAVMSEKMIRNLGKGLAYAALGIFIVVGFVFRSFDFAFKSILPNLIPLAGTAAIIVLAGESMHYNSVLALTIGLGIAIDDSIQFLFRFRHELRVSNGDARIAAARTLNSVGKALTTTSLVLVAGLGALLCCSLPMARVFAIIIIMVIIFALIADLIILPALMCWNQKNRLNKR